MTKHGVTIAIMGGICGLVFAAAATPTSAAGNVAFLAHNGSGSACSQVAPCADMVSAIAVAGFRGEVICLDKGLYLGGFTITQSVTISCGDGLWETPGTVLGVNTPAGSVVVIEGLVLDGSGFLGNLFMNGQGALHLRRVRFGNNQGSSN